MYHPGNFFATLAQTVWLFVGGKNLPSAPFLWAKVPKSSRFSCPRYIDPENWVQNDPQFF